MAHRKLLTFSLCLLGYSSSVLVSRAKSIPIDISQLLNNKAFGTYPNETSFDKLGQSYPPPRPEYTPHYTSSTTGITYSFPGYTGPSEPDNVISKGQAITIPNASLSNSSRIFSVSFLISGDVEFATVKGNVSFQYTDNSTSTYELRTLDWFSWLTLNRGGIVFPYRYTSTGVNWNTSHIFERTAALDARRKLRSITLPDTETSDTEGRMHVFAISLWSGPSAGGSVGVGVQAVRPTQKWFGAGEQVVEITVNNAGSKCVAGTGLTLSLVGEGFKTIRPGNVKRLCPGDQKVIKIGVEGSSNGPVNVSVVIETGNSINQQKIDFSDVEIGLTDWTPDLDNLARHESPDWFDGAKFGIFIHWGVYAVTGWGNSTPHESYAEWFWWYSTHHPQADPSDFYDYRLRTYGPDWAYDDTFPDFTASAFDAKAWVDLFADAGAQYFVITSKHHDGFALFDTGATSNRSSLHYGPRRDLLRELFDAAATYQPSLRRGTYFSLPEWYNPDFGPYGFDQLPASSVPGTNSWPGVPARNPYTNLIEPYTGHVPVSDFIADVILPQMNILARDYETDIMWCDIGAANATAIFAADWWSSTRAANRQVAINSRCGLAQAADFDTPEYATFSSAQARKWESSMGMDPYSYGYNAATPDEAYMNASTLIRTLVDVVAKNGNLLLDIGPRADGTIVQPEVDALREAGRWIRAHGEAVFNTTYWFVQSEIQGEGEGLDVRFTQTDDAFYALFLEKPVVENGLVKVPAPLPILEGDEVSLLAVDGGENLVWKASGEGDQKVLNIEADDALLDKDEFCWVFKIKYA
ncbi:glycoside hydrolase family 29 protein [Xylariaceae sp. AK1471]|nr:glycoside hydrolase family 29 protein [Xylariaceae sp. AK1471]